MLQGNHEFFGPLSSIESIEDLELGLPPSFHVGRPYVLASPVNGSVHSLSDIHFSAEKKGVYNSRNTERSWDCELRLLLWTRSHGFPLKGANAENTSCLRVAIKTSPCQGADSLHEISGGGLANWARSLLLRIGRLRLE